MDTVKVVEDEPLMKILLHLAGVLVEVNFGGAFLDQTVGSFHHPVGFGCVRARLAMFDGVVMADLGEQRELFGGSVAVLEALKRELAPVVGENLLDLKREELKASAQKVARGGSVFILVNAQIKQARGPIYGHKAVVFLAIKLGQVKAVDMEEARAILLTP